MDTKEEGYFIPLEYEPPRYPIPIRINPAMVVPFLAGVNKDAYYSGAERTPKW